MGKAVSERRRQILDAAAAAFHQKGFHGVGVDEIGARAGLSGPALYRHFAGKDELLAALLDEAMDELMGALGTSVGDPGQDLDHALRHHLDFALRRADLVTLYQREVRSLASPWSEAFRRRRAEYAARWQQLIARRFPQAPGEVTAPLAQACLGTIFSVPTWPAGTRRGPEAHDVVLSLLTGGMTAAAAERH